ncbi:helix-turn-helix domain-containing protein [Sediminivirga luteola]|uniref:helix-turn-helix domain-containing protein n=1 Tax=Sediminivirga luteola TaxID=1774748 RepID=UPI001F5A194B|nr:helix-turn-helix domain-containing protein [Sediminivirga luteola]MCI2264642.1 helix-turn-helix domain-containing protein [Sediminivirga luteola]
MHTSASITHAARAQLRRIDMLVIRYRGAVRELPGYLPSAITDAELDRTSREVLTLLLRHIAGDEVHRELTAYSQDIGRRRARQGLPLDSLLRAVRMDFRFLWEALVPERVPAGRAELSADVLAIWDAVELHTSQVQSAYIEESMQLRRELEAERGYLLERLLSGEVREENQLRHAAEALGLQPDARILLLVAAPAYRREFRSGLRRAFPEAQVHTAEGADVALLDSGRLDAQGWQRVRSLPAGIPPSPGSLGELHDVWPVARRLARQVRSAEAGAEFGEHWESALDEGFAVAVEAHRADVMRRLDELPEHARADLQATVRHYLRSGSILETSRALFCHRNTVLKRLHRFTELTGLDPAVPWDAATIRLLLR